MILKRPKTGQKVCKECFFDLFETEIHELIVKENMFKRGERVAIGASGGKGMLSPFMTIRRFNDTGLYPEFLESKVRLWIGFVPVVY